MECLPIHFHVGAHKTATTYLQSCLRENRKNLSRRGIRFIDMHKQTEDLKAYRKCLKAALWKKSGPDITQLREATRRLRELVTRRLSGKSQTGLLVLSYENTPGSYDVTGDGIYPHADLGVQHALQAFPECDTTFFFAFRRVDHFLESCYLQMVYTKKETRDFKKYLAHVNIDKLRWMPVIESMESACGKDHLRLWDYGSFFRNEDIFWRYFLDTDDARAILESPARRSNPSLSKTGLYYMRKINGFMRTPDNKTFRLFIKKNFCVTKENPKPTFVDHDLRERLLRQYEDDCSTMNERFDLLFS
jgi:hypothetical protein